MKPNQTPDRKGSSSHPHQKAPAKGGKETQRAPAPRNNGHHSNGKPELKADRHSSEKQPRKNDPNSVASKQPSEGSNNQAIPFPKFFYDNDKGSYWRQASNGIYVKTKEADLRRFCRSLGIDVDTQGIFRLTKFDAAIVKAQDQGAVDHVIALAGHNAGIFTTEDGRRILVPRAPKLIQPQPGKFDNFETLFDELFGPEQSAYVLSWLAIALEDLYTLNPAAWRHNQMLALVGKPNCGKSFFQSLVTSMLGGRAADPYLWLIGKANFNEELAESEHLMMEDKNAFRDIKSRTTFGSSIKQLTVSSTMAAHGKGKKAVLLPSFRRLTISINDDAEYITVLPMLDRSVEDKLMLIKCSKASMLSDYKENRERFQRELPAFIHFLLRIFKLPVELKHERFGVRSYHNPEIVEQLQQFEPHLRFREILDAVLFSQPDDYSWKGTSSELQAKLIDSAHSSSARQLLPHSTACGQLLAKLMDVEPERFSKTMSKGTAKWQIMAPR